MSSYYDSGGRRENLLEEEKALLEAQITALEEGKSLRKSFPFIFAVAYANGWEF